MSKATGLLGVVFSLIFLFSPAISYSYIGFTNPFPSSDFGVIPERGSSETTPPLLQHSTFSYDRTQLPREDIEFINSILDPTVNGFNAMIEPQTGLPWDVVDAFNFTPVKRKVSGLEISMQILSVIAQRDMNMISPEVAQGKMNRILDSIQQAAGINGFLYEFVSLPELDQAGNVADVYNNGQLAAALMIANQAFKGTEVERRTQEILDKMDFNFFYDRSSGKMYGDSNRGYTVGQFGSEALLSEFIAILKDDVPETVLPPSESIGIHTESYRTQDGREIKVIPAWGGQIWTILFPLLFWGPDIHPGFMENARRWVEIQVEESIKKNFNIWGWSPSATASDYYQYTGENGIPGLEEYGFAGNPKTNPVAIYVSFLALGVLKGYEGAKEQLISTIENLKNIKELNPDAYNSERGFIDSISQDGKIAPFLLGLDKGMEVVSLYNYLQRSEGSQGIEKYFWSYLEEIGKADEGRRLLNQRGKEILQVIGATASTPPEEPTPPAVPKNLSVDEITSEEIKLSWANVVEARGFTVWIEGETVEYSKKFDTPANSLTLNVEEAGLIPGETYNFKVSAYHVFPGGGVLESEWSEPVSFTIPEGREKPSELTSEERQAIEATTAVKSIKIWARQKSIRRQEITLDEDKLVEDLAEIEPLVKQGIEPFVEQLAEALNRQGIEVEVSEVSKEDFALEDFYKAQQELPFLMRLDPENLLKDRGFITVTNVYHALNPDLDWTPWREEDIIDYYNADGKFREFIGDQDYRPYWDGFVLHLKTEAPPVVDLKILEQRTSMGFFTDGTLGSGFESWTDDSERGEVLQIEYDVSDGARWSGLYVKLPNLNISGYNKFNIGIKGRTQGIPGRVKIELKRNRETIWSTTISGLTLDWKDFSVSMPSNLGRIDEVTIVFSYGMGGDLNGAVYIDPQSFGFLK